MLENNIVVTAVKYHLTYDEQIKLLKGRGCIIEDDKACKEILRHVNYYRLSAYFPPFKNPDDTFKEGVTFDKLYQIYEFDRKLRNIIFGAVEAIEISFKARIAYCHAQNHGPLGYLDETTFNPRHDHEEFKKKIADEIDRNTKSPIVKHHKKKYGGQFPLWAMTELFTFGMTSKFYADMLAADKKAVCGKLLNHAKVESWLNCVTVLRNTCAHYRRLYGGSFSNVPKSIKVDNSAKRSLWANVLCIKELYPSVEKWNLEILFEFKTLFEKYEPYIDLNQMSFPKEWISGLTK